MMNLYFHIEFKPTGKALLAVAAPHRRPDDNTKV
jgi:hypothetical protein